MRSTALAAAILSAMALASWFAAGAQAVQRISFVITTGTTDGTYFPVGEAIANIVSHPPGVSRCQQVDVCGPAGLIASVRTSPGAVANVLAVNEGTADAGLAQSDVVGEAVAGRGVFRKFHPQSHVRVLASLFPEEVHLIAAKSAHIRSPADLRGKRVGLGPENSGTIVTARAVLAAYGVTRMKANTDSSDIAADELDSGKLDAMFFVGGAPVPLVRNLLREGHAQLIAISGKQRERLLKTSPALAQAAIPANLYAGTGQTETIATHAVLIVNQSAPAELVQGIAKSLFNPVNRGTLAGSERSAQFIRIDTAAQNPPAPLHPGAARFFAEMGKLPKPATGKPASR